MQKNYYFTSESVTEGHPDKLCDFISDSLLDEYLKQEPNSRVAIETFATKNKVVVSGEVTSKAEVNIELVVRNAIKEIGYGNEQLDINPDICEVDIEIVRQSPDIALGVDEGGAGDQGIMFGFATNETDNYMPFAINMAHKLSKRLTEVRKTKELEYLRPDGKTQVTVEYENDIPKRIETILISNQYEKDTDIKKMRNDIIEKIVKKVIPHEYIDKDTKIYVNPTGRFIIGGPLGDTGLTGRKIIVDTYGGYARHGGGAFSGKDASKVDRSAAKIYVNPTGRFIIGGPLGDTGLTGRKIIVDTYGGYARHGGGAFSGKDASKVDRSAAYMMRHIAKNIVANKYADKCELQVSYAIGMKEPMSIYINTFGTNKVPESEIIDIVKKKFDLTPQGIIKYLELQKPIYKKTTNYGHFGKEDLSWEKIVKI